MPHPSMKPLAQGYHTDLGGVCCLTKIIGVLDEINEPPVPPPVIRSKPSWDDQCIQVLRGGVGGRG